MDEAGLTRVWLLRHAETAEPTVFHGAESDVGLSERGLRQARLLAPVVAGWRPDAVVSSAMTRARLTAQPIAAACGLDLRLEPELHERRVGALSGTPFHAKEGVWQETLRRWMSGQTDFAPPGAESFDAIRRRVLPVWDRLTEEFARRTLVVVAHGVVCKVLLFSLVSELSVADWHRVGPIRNVGVHELAGKAGNWQLRRLNEVPEVISAD